MKKFIWLFVLLLQLSSVPLLAYFVPEEKDKFSGLKVFNGYRFDQFGDFTKNWRLVTVRYRKDSEEMRIVYANEKAWKALKAGGKKYPDGAIFAKIGLKTAADPTFVSSVVPSGSKRIQYMVRNEKRHASTDGWGYALFDSDGKTFPGEPKAAQIACHTCHQIVSDKAFVFSEIAAISLRGGQGSMQAVMPKLDFEELDRKAMPKNIRDLIPENFEKLSSIKGALRKNIFPGTVDEIRVYLAQEAAVKKRPAILFTEDASAYSLVYPVFENKCPAPGAPTLHSFTKGSKNAPVPAELTFCH